MALPKVTREEVIQRLLTVFRLHGYEGASLALISQEVGLQKASLYHLFPGGKEEMAKAVVESVGEFLRDHVFASLRGRGTPGERLAGMIAQVKEFYGAGQLSCLLDTLSLGGRDHAFRELIGNAMSAWIEALAALARENGATAAVARQRAERVLVTIQGTLVVSRCVGDPKVFARGLRELPGLLLPETA